MVLLSMAATSSSSSYKLQALAIFISRYRTVAGGSWRSHHTHHRDLPPYKVGGGGSIDQGLRCLSVHFFRETNQSEAIPEQQQYLPAPPKFVFSNWVKWLMGSAVTFLIPFWKNKWDNLLTLEAKAAKVMGEVEVVAEVVEKVAAAADKALEEVVKELPDNSKLKEAAQELEHVSNVAAHDAQIIENIINKVSDVKQDLEDLESIVEPIVDKLIQGKHTKK